ncbi:hypothetical protein Lepto7375DRAFT_4839 [Leptolyngbya sp. PCC 7375]|nr:hypothetical protein Lepto7375DRAFT_4839 [Leptolyngbya sp. PCC 7375]
MDKLLLLVNKVTTDSTIPESINTETSSKLHKFFSDSVSDIADYHFTSLDERVLVGLSLYQHKFLEGIPAFKHILVKPSLSMAL